MSTSPGVRLIWTRRALDHWQRGHAVPSHTISAPNVAEVYDGFVRQLRPGTPWALVNGWSEVLDAGTAGSDR